MIEIRRKIIFVEELQLGNFLFQGYITERKEGTLSYSIYVEKFSDPFIEMIPDENLIVSIFFNDEIVDFIDKHKTQDKNQRKMIFKKFLDFTLNSEKKAAYMVFKNRKLDYIKKSKEIVELKKKYLGT